MQNTHTHTERIDNLILKIYHDEDPTDPREWDSLGTMVCLHKRYKLGDEHGYTAGDFEGWEDMEQTLKAEKDIHTILPLYLYDHSGLSISTRPFGCPWDSGRIGVIYVTNKKVREEGINPEKVEEYLRREVAIYDQYLTGDVYRYEISRVSVCDHGCEHTELIDSCGGFFGEEKCISEAKSALNYYVTA